MRTLRLPDALDGLSVRSWLKNEGDPVRGGEAIAMLVRTKSNGSVEGGPQRLTADADGVVHRLIGPEGHRCVAGMPMALLGDASESAGFEPTAVRAVRIAMLRQCTECGADYPLNGLVDRARCARCGDVQTSPPSFWSETVGPTVFEASKPRHWVEAVRKDEHHGETRIQAWGVLPLCRACHGLLDWTAVRESVDKARSGPSSIACGACGESHRVRLPPAWAHDMFASLVLLVGETAADPSGAPAQQPVVFKCPSCLGPLRIDGAKRIIHCQHCASDVYLPDDLWVHFNPASRRGRWWMLMRP
jgi:pyruvate/2-oxoglutarate dehydrogenase complex dihydrolipoamide acyltransferase (E2) component